MALTNTQTVALQLEKVRKKLPILYERGDVLFNIIEKRDVEKVSTRTARIPLQVQPGGAFGYASLDGGDLGRGSGTIYDVAQITPVGLRFAVEINKLVEYATNASEKAVADVAKKQVADAMKQFRRDLDAQLQTAGNAVMGTVSAIVGNPTFTLSSTPFGARLVRENQVLQIYDSTITTNRGTVLVTNRQQGLGLTQTVSLAAGTCPLGNIQINDVLLPDGLSGASPVGLYGIPYHHNTSSSGTWMGISRANPYAQADLVNANGNGFALPFVRLAKHKIMQNIGIEEAEALKSLRWYSHPAQQAAYHEIAFSISMLSKTGGDQSFDMMFGSESIAGIKPIWNPHADETRMDLLNLETWGRVEWKEIDYLEIGGQTVFPVYGSSGGIAAAYLFYLICGQQYFVDNPRAVGGIVSLGVPQNY